ncbi:RDD family protein [Undibacterium danionis]|uniref:RDD family protein n=1 Tax=Undibacterium danionis TaxID=1812100 RepID=A0ABV6IH16_9BURK
MDQTQNPYSPPTAEVLLPEGAVTGKLNLAGNGRRFGTLVVDYLGYLLLAFIVGVVVAIVFGEDGVRAMEKTPDLVLGVPILFLYFGFFEFLWGRTPGKLLFGTRVVNEEGGRVSFGQVLGRTACRFIPFEAFSFLFAERGWHDSISRTRVVIHSKPYL